MLLYTHSSTFDERDVFLFLCEAKRSDGSVRHYCYLYKYYIIIVIIISDKIHPAQRVNLKSGKERLCC